MPMHRVILRDIALDEILKLRYQLICDGLVINEDFEWEWHPAVWDGFTQERPRHTVFSFRNPALATFYQLKWA
jgi:hypothetical protein